MSAPGSDGAPVAPSEAGVDNNAMAVPDPPTPDWSQNSQQEQQPTRRAAEPAPDWLGPIQQRMDELGMTTAQIAQALELDGDDGQDELDWDNLTDAELGAALAPELGDELDEGYEEGDAEGDEPDEVERLADAIEQRFRSHEDARDAFEEREDAFDELRESLPILQNEQIARRVVGRARDLATSWDPSLIEKPAFVGLVELVALASIAEQVREREAAHVEPRPVQLEAASGAVPQPDRRDESEKWGDRIVQAARALRPQI
jgi:hypothetical protein